MGDTRKRSAWFRVPSPAMTVACVALAVALSGVGYAAVVLPANSVGSAQVKYNALRGADINEARLGKVPNANRLDSLDSTAFLRAGTVRLVSSVARGGPLPATAFPFTATKGSLVVNLSATGFRASGGQGCVQIQLRTDAGGAASEVRGTCMFFNLANVHATLPTLVAAFEVTPGKYWVRLEPALGLVTDNQDLFRLWIYEMPNNCLGTIC